MPKREQIKFTDLTNLIPVDLSDDGVRVEMGDDINLGFVEVKASLGEKDMLIYLPWQADMNGEISVLFSPPEYMPAIVPFKDRTKMGFEAAPEPADILNDAGRILEEGEAAQAISLWADFNDDWKKPVLGHIIQAQGHL